MLSSPQGRYLAATGVARANSGGQTRALLLRSRLISAATGWPVDVLCFDPSSGYDGVRAQWRAGGLLSDRMRLLNIYEHYRSFGWGDEPSSGERLLVPEDLEAVEKRHPDGTPWQTSYVDPQTRQVMINDFRRGDGSVYLRAVPYQTVSAETLPHELIRINPDGEILGRFASLTQWYQQWVRELTAGDARTFLFLDSRYLVPIFAPFDDPDVHLIYLLHNCHTPAPRLWSTPPAQDYRRCLECVGDVDAFVTLTERQRRDIELRWGRRSNLEVVPNPVERPASRRPGQRREPHRVILLARLERQKRVQHAILVMKRVRRQIPDARLDIYGAGRRQQQLQDMIDKHRLTDVVTLHGYDPEAREQLWGASAFLLTSEFEGYPLATLESLSRGCPVVAYDIPYGPREQITDGVDGFLIPAGDIAAAAERVVQLLSDPDLVRRMGAAGIERAYGHGTERFLHDWARVLDAVVERAPRRLAGTNVQALLRAEPWGRMRGWPFSRARRVSLSGVLHVTTASRDADPDRGVITLEVMDKAVGERTEVAVHTRRNGLDHHFRAVLNPAELFRAMPQSQDLVVRVRFTWENYSWESLFPALKQRPDTAESEPAETLRLRPPVARSAQDLNRWRDLARRMRRRVRRRRSP